MSKVVGGDYLLGDREKEVLRRQIRKVSRFCGVEVLTYCLISLHPACGASPGQVGNY